MSSSLPSGAVHALACIAACTAMLASAPSAAGDEPEPATSNFFTPTRGVYVDLSVPMFRGSYGSDRDFETANLTAMWFRPLSEALCYAPRATKAYAVRAICRARTTPYIRAA